MYSEGAQRGMVTVSKKALFANDAICKLGKRGGLSASIRFFMSYNLSSRPAIRKYLSRDDSMTASKTLIIHSHLDSLYFDAPRIRGLVERLLHDVADGLALREDLRQVLRAQHVAKGGRRQQVRGVAERE